ncbi:MAG: hypothetical protein COA88_14660 [Kordia sp.]|nr:MAG: hypothetical protein COA88_14660 [Kordia sp.]
MAGILLRHIVDDIAKDFKQVFDDKIIQKSQFAYWVLLIGNRLRAQHISKRDSGAFLSTFIVPVNVHTVNNNPNEIKSRKHIILPKCIYDYDEDKGIEYMSYYVEERIEGCRPPFTNQTFTRTTPKASERLYFSKYETPNPKNPYFYRVSDHLYLLGIECVDVKNIEIGIYSTLDPVTEIDLDAPFDFPEELLIQLKRQVLDLGRFVLLVPEERVNDGNDNIEGAKVPTNKITSVNELSQDTPNNK